MKITEQVQELLVYAMRFAQGEKHEYLTPEHLLYALTKNKMFCDCFEECDGDLDLLKECLEEYFFSNISIVKKKEPQPTNGFNEVMAQAEQMSLNNEDSVVEIKHIVWAIMNLENSYAKYYLEMQEIHQGDLIACFEEYEESGRNQNFQKEDSGNVSFSHDNKRWRQFVVCINEIADHQNPLIGRTKELERTIEILCRKDKNNPMHIGESGVGKTAITYGLAKAIENHTVPEELKGAKIYSLDLGGMIAGTQYRGDFEKRFKQIMNGIDKEEKPILYIDEIHNIIGAGSSGNSTLDIANMLKPYLVSGHIRFIGATTYDEYNKYFSKNKSLVRRFQNIEIKEPTIEEAIEICNGLKQSYEDFHHVTYTKEAIRQAVILSDKYINDRYLPDKAIDILDEAGAYRKLHPEEEETNKVTKKLIENILSKICKVPKQTVETNEIEKLSTLKENLSSKVFGQPEAITQIVNAIKFNRAGLSDENKPIASLLFVGPTGVGKTEVCKVLAKEMGVKLIRFDMSEYTEKHSIAKLIGAPAGYVGYEEGGLLTDAIRKTPYAVLLLDEIEKAHPDIYNILLQVMDYATLSDNQGRKADFRNVILIMTSNAGASSLGKTTIGFEDQKGDNNAIQDAVKRTFQPEFRNRLNKIVIFNSMNHTMASSITDKKIMELKEMLKKKKITLDVSDDAKNYLLKKGITNVYGAREIDRVIQNEMKPLLVDEVLFGKLKEGGRAEIILTNDKLSLKIKEI